MNNPWDTKTPPLFSEKKYVHVFLSAGSKKGFKKKKKSVHVAFSTNLAPNPTAQPWFLRFGLVPDWPKHPASDSRSTRSSSYLETTW